MEFLFTLIVIILIIFTGGLFIKILSSRIVLRFIVSILRVFALEWIVNKAWKRYKTTKSIHKSDEKDEEGKVEL